MLIEIEKSYDSEYRHKGFYFLDGESKGYMAIFHKDCEACGDSYVDDNYYGIIKCLIKAGLLDVNYPLLCCKCWEEWEKKGYITL